MMLPVGAHPICKVLLGALAGLVLWDASIIHDRRGSPSGRRRRRDELRDEPQQPPPGIGGAAGVHR